MRIFPLVVFVNSTICIKSVVVTAAIEGDVFTGCVEVVVPATTDKRLITC